MNACQRCFKPHAYESQSFPNISLCKGCSFEIGKVEHFLNYVGWRLVPVEDPVALEKSSSNGAVKEVGEPQKVG